MSKRYKQWRRFVRGNPFRLDFTDWCYCPRQFDIEYGTGDIRWVAYIRARGHRVRAELRVISGFKFTPIKLLGLYEQELSNPVLFGEFGAGWLGHDDMVRYANPLLKKCFTMASQNHSIRDLPYEIRNLIFLDAI